MKPKITPLQKEIMVILHDGGIIQPAEPMCGEMDGFYYLLDYRRDYAGPNPIAFRTIKSLMVKELICPRPKKEGIGYVAIQ